MFVSLLDKQRRAASAVKTALLGVGISGRSICIQAASWTAVYGDYENYAVFVSAAPGSNAEPYYETGKTIVEAVKKAIDSIKGRTNDAKSGAPEVAPF